MILCGRGVNLFLNHTAICSCLWNESQATKKAEELAEKVLDYEAEKTEYARNYAELEKKLEEMHDQMSLAPA
ncbi:hypothetical protein SARC_16479, partial [Sphaeroforma arctica JP610]